MLSNTASLLPAAPELALAAGTTAVLLLGLIFPRASRWPVLALTLATLCAAALAVVVTAPATPLALFGGLLARDSFGDFFKLLFAAAGALVALASVRARDLLDQDSGDADAPEVMALLLAVVLGANLMASAQDLLTSYLALEFVSLLSYLLTGFTRGARRSAEAALKYAIYGGAATAAMLYGFSLLFGFSSSTELGAVRAAAAAAPPLTVAVAVTLCLAGFAFKMAVVPFHMWCPDVYEGAPTPVAAFFSVVPKAAGFALAYRFLLGPLLPAAVQDNASANVGVGATVSLLGATGPAAAWAVVVAVLAALTMTVGNLAALGQQNLKRLLAYSSIAHAGTILMALAVGTQPALESMLLYLAVYLFMNLAAFLTVAAVAEHGLGESVAVLAGLGRRAPAAAFCLTVSLFSLTGLPPTAGFVAKYSLFAAVVRRGTEGGGAPFFLLAFWGALNTVVSLYYYARVVRVMYFDGARPSVPTVPSPSVPVPVPVPALRLAPLHLGLLAVTTAPVLILGVYMTPLSDLVARSVGLWASGR